MGAPDGGARSSHHQARRAASQVTYFMHKPLLPFLQLDALPPTSSADGAQTDIFSRFAAGAARDPSHASGIQVTIVACTELDAVDAAAARPYVQYEFPGYAGAVVTATKRGVRPAYHEARTFEFAPNPQTTRAFMDALRASQLTLVVFDAAAATDNAHIGICNIALECVDPVLAQHARVCRAVMRMRRHA